MEVDLGCVLPWHGQAEMEGGANPFLTFYPDASLMRYDKVFANGQSQPGTSLAVIQGSINLVKFIKQMGYFVSRNAGAGILDADHNFPICLFRANPDHTFLNIALGITEQIEQDLSDTQAIHFQGG